MASYAYTFSSGDTVTPARLNDARTVSNIVNADISATAAIAGTKVSPNFGSQNVLSSGYIESGTSFRGNNSDTASAPSYTWTGDTNTGMFHPEMDTIAFAEGGNERMRINSSGNVLLFATTEINVSSGTSNGATFFASEKSLHISRNDAPAVSIQRTGGDGAALMFYRNTANVGNVSITTTATTYNTSSDYRLKQNIEPMSGGLAKLAQLKPSTFEFIAEPGVKVDGFIAHEVQAIVPQAVTGVKDGEEMQGIDQSKLVPILVAALQELSAKVAALEARLA
jgi:hypothetical protein